MATYIIDRLEVDSEEYRIKDTASVYEVTYGVTSYTEIQTAIGSGQTPVLVLTSEHSPVMMNEFTEELNGTSSASKILVKYLGSNMPKYDLVTENTNGSTMNSGHTFGMYSGYNGTLNSIKTYGLSSNLILFQVNESNEWSYGLQYVSHLNYITLSNGPFVGNWSEGVFDLSMTSEAITNIAKAETAVQPEDIETEVLSVSTSELNYLAGVRSNIQDQLDAKQNALTIDTLTATTSELNYVSGVTSSIQTQLNNKENIGKITIDGTEYTVRTSSEDAGLAEYITFVLED